MLVASAPPKIHAKTQNLISIQEETSNTCVVIITFFKNISRRISRHHNINQSNGQKVTVHGVMGNGGCEERVFPSRTFVKDDMMSAKIPG